MASKPATAKTSRPRSAERYQQRRETSDVRRSLAGADITGESVAGDAAR